MQSYTLEEFKDQHPHGLINNVRLDALARGENPDEAKVLIDGKAVEFNKLFIKHHIIKGEK